MRKTTLVTQRKKKLEVLPKRTPVDSYNQQMLLSTTYYCGSKGDAALLKKLAPYLPYARKEGGPENKSSPEVTIYDQACKYNCLNSQEHFKYSGKSISKKEGFHN